MNLDNSEYEKLITVYDDFQLESIKNLLDDAKISYEIKTDVTDDSPAIMKELNISGSTIYVPIMSLINAQEVLNLVLGITFESNDTEK